jgi:hypothetical protein
MNDFFVWVDFLEIHWWLNGGTNRGLLILSRANSDMFLVF